MATLPLSTKLFIIEILLKAITRQIFKSNDRIHIQHTQYKLSNSINTFLNSYVLQNVHYL